MFSTIELPESTVDVVTRVLSHAICSGSVRVGERLPPERKLASDLSVNRVTVRSALDRLTTAGLVSRRQGSGYRVLDFRRTGGPSVLGAIAHVAREQGELGPIVEDLLAMRRSLARTLMETLRMRLTDAGLQHIQSAIEAFAQVASQPHDLQALLHADMEVVMALFVASDSRVLPLCFNPVMETLQGLPELVAAMYAAPKDNVMAYRALIGLLKAAPPNLAHSVDTLLESRDRKVLERLALEPTPS